VSSSGHLVVVPALLRWPYARADADVRKSFEVALHAGAGLALLWLMRDELTADLRETVLLAGPAAVAGLAFEPFIEERLSDPRVAAAAQIVAGAALVAADMRRSAGSVRLALVGAAQATALVPGVSRNGAALTAARAQGADRATAARLSWRAGLPVIAGATVLKTARLGRRGLTPQFAAGAAAAFASTLAAAPLLRTVRGPWAPIGAYRIAFGALALRRLHRLQWPDG
jgi:undecaprenyl-diphosphatase